MATEEEERREEGEGAKREREEERRGGGRGGREGERAQRAAERGAYVHTDRLRAYAMSSTGSGYRLLLQDMRYRDDSVWCYGMWGTEIARGAM
eukprot:3649258-Rhodomonas_salina.1